MNATSSDRGMSVATMSAAEASSRNTNSTPTTKSAPSSRLCPTVCSVAETSSVRS
jgi:hypothetical protein